MIMAKKSKFAPLNRSKQILAKIKREGKVVKVETETLFSDPEGFRKEMQEVEHDFRRRTALSYKNSGNRIY